MTIIEKDYGRQPWNEEGWEKDSFKGYVERNKKPTWFNELTKKLMRLSEFNRPWKSDGYPQMEYSFPAPEWIEPRPIDQYGYELLDKLGGCAVNCFPPAKCEDDVFCHPARYQYSRNMNTIEGAEAIGYNVFLNGAEYGNYSYRVRNQYGVLQVFPLKIHPPTATGAWARWPDDPMDEIKVEMYDAAGNFCTTTLKVFCRGISCCDEEGYSFAFDDDSTPDTIAPGGDITVTIIGGCPPYTWQVSGTGYTFDDTVSSNLTNTLNCAAGDCGVDYDPYASLTITDDCDTSVTAKILNTGGQWVTIEDTCGEEQSYTYSCTGSIIGDIYRYGMYAKLAAAQSCLAGCCADAKAHCADYGFNCTVGGATCGSFCGSDFGLGAPNTNYCFHWGGSQCSIVWIYKQEWQC